MQPIHTAILSFGMSGQVFHAPFIHNHEGFYFYAVWERSKNLAKEKYPEVKTYRTLEELLADPVVELVIVNTPNTTHYEYTKKSLEAGKHVIVEKPFTATVEEGRQLIELASSKNLQLSVFHNRRWDSDFLAVKQVVHEGMLGDIVEAEFHFDRYKEELSPKLHKETPGPGTGVIYDLGSHIIDQALHLFGRPDAVFADIRIIRPQSMVDDYFEILFYYPSLRVRLHSSYLVKEPVPSYIIHGSKGSFLKSRSDIQEAALVEGQQPVNEGWGKEPAAESGLIHTTGNDTGKRYEIVSPAGNYMNYFNGIYKSLRFGEPLPVTAADGLAVIEIIDAAIKSNAEGQRVEI